MSDIAEIERIGNEAAQDEAETAQATGAAGPEILTQGNTAEEFADFLDMAANVAGVGFSLPTIPQRFNHGANVNISAAAVKLCEKYGFDPRAVLLGGDSIVAVWLGLAVSIGMPAYGCVMDYKVMKAREVKQESQHEAENGNVQQPAE